MDPKPHRLETDEGPPSWQRVSTTTVPPLVTMSESYCSSVLCTPPSVSTQHESRHDPEGLLPLRVQWMSVVASCVRGLQSWVDVP